MSSAEQVSPPQGPQELGKVTSHATQCIFPLIYAKLDLFRKSDQSFEILQTWSCFKMWLLCFAEFLRPNSMASWCWQERVKENPKAEATINQRPPLCPLGRRQRALRPRLCHSGVPGKEIQSAHMWSPAEGVKGGVCQLVCLTLRQSPLHHRLKPDQNNLQHKFSFQEGSNLLSWTPCRHLR